MIGTNPKSEAIEYGRRGWPVLPLHHPTPAGCSCGRAGCNAVGKHPMVSRGVHSATIDGGQIGRWFEKWPRANVGVATGAASGLVVLDQDPRNGSEDTIAQLQGRHGPLPATVECLTGGGGRHLYFKHPGFPVKNDGAAKRLGRGLDIKGDGGLVVAPPSIHQSGRAYEWELSSHPDEMPLADLPGWLLQVLVNAQPVTDRESTPSESLTEQTEQTEQTEIASVSQAISITLPQGTGERNRKLFDFARALRAIPGFADRPASDLKAAVRQWHSAALPFIATKEWDETWSDFSVLWPKVKFAQGAAVLSEAIARADVSSLPMFAREYESAPAQRLIKLCRELQRIAGSEKPFFLSCRSAGTLLGVDRDTSARLLKMLVQDEILRLAKQATKTKAARYLYVKSD